MDDSCTIASKAKRAIEEILPFVTFLFRARRKWRLINKNCEILQEKEYQRYSEIRKEDLDKRLTEERERASLMDAKTFKLTLSLSIALTVLGSVSTTLSNQIMYPHASTIFLTLVMLSTLYFLGSGLVALGALKTLPLYGYGTRILLTNQDELQQCLAMCLAQTEAANTVRHLRNETSYQMLRNGFLLFILAAITFATLS